MVDCLTSRCKHTHLLFPQRSSFLPEPLHWPSPLLGTLSLKQPTGLLCQVFHLSPRCTPWSFSAMLLLTLVFQVSLHIPQGHIYLCSPPTWVVSGPAFPSGMTAAGNLCSTQQRAWRLSRHSGHRRGMAESRHTKKEAESALEKVWSLLNNNHGHNCTWHVSSSQRLTISGRRRAAGGLVPPRSDFPRTLPVVSWGDSCLQAPFTGPDTVACHS